MRGTPFRKDLIPLQEEEALKMSFRCLGIGAVGGEPVQFWGRKTS